MSASSHPHFNAVNVSLDELVDKFRSYEEYLDSRVEKKDLFFLEDDDAAKHLYELGFPGKGEHVTRDQFETRKHIKDLAKQMKDPDPTDMSSRGLDLSHSAFLQCLAAREEGNRAGLDSTIIFLRATNELGQEVSAYIDYADRLQRDNFRQYFEGRRKMLPKPTDLSYYNWNTNVLKMNSSPNYEVLCGNPSGIRFRHKRDRRLVLADPKAKDPGQGTKRITIQTLEYEQCTLFEHTPRRQV